MKINKNHFPILKTKVNNKPLVYFDNAATTQKPVAVIQAINHFYQFHNSNVHRGIHTLSQEATNAYENARISVQKFINAKSADEIILTKGATESINLVAASFGEKFIKPGDEIILSTLEHHANIVPWQMLAKKKRAKLKTIPVKQSGQLEFSI
jgi:cysteine desulfurase/selenocysteine lyase